MAILVLNIGSSSVKYEAFGKDESIIKGIIEEVTSFSEAIKQVLSILKKENIEVSAVGHRVVHGGTIEKSQVIDIELIKHLKELSELAPLHNFPEIKGMRAAMKQFDVPHVAVFDTSFHQSMPEKAFTYAIPQDLAEKHKIRRYGFHGTSHKYVAQEACTLLKQDIKKNKIITCHLGNGCSITAINKGKSIDTSMGFTPLEGVVMGTRCGDIDPAILTFLMDHDLYATDEINDILNKKSGLLGISEISSDMRELLKSKDKKAKLAIDIFCYRIIKYLGAYTAALNGADLIVFTGGIGENVPKIRKEILSNLDHLGIKIDDKKNKKNEVLISDKKSKIKVAVIPADEAKMIAREVKQVLKK